MLIIGLTGGIASGKSTVAGLFIEFGSRLVDTDIIARLVVEPGQPGFAAVLDAFGPEFLTQDGRLDRQKVRADIFANEAKRHRLEGILHPLIRVHTLNQLNEITDCPYVILAVPLLIETDFAEFVDRILVVDVPVETQLERLMTRDGISRAEAEAMLAAQADRETRLARADDVIDNSGDLEGTRAQVKRLHRRYLDLATVCREEPGRAE